MSVRRHLRGARGQFTLRQQERCAGLNVRRTGKDHVHETAEKESSESARGPCAEQGRDGDEPVDLVEDRLVDEGADDDGTLLDAVGAAGGQE